MCLLLKACDSPFSSLVAICHHGSNRLLIAKSDCLFNFKQISGATPQNDIATPAGGRPDLKTPNLESGMNLGAGFDSLPV